MDLSSKGCRISGSNLPAGAEVWVEIEGYNPNRATVVRQKRGELGCEFYAAPTKVVAPSDRPLASTAIRVERPPPIARTSAREIRRRVNSAKDDHIRPHLSQGGLSMRRFLETVAVIGAILGAIKLGLTFANARTVRQAEFAAVLAIALAVISYCLAAMAQRGDIIHELKKARTPPNA